METASNSDYSLFTTSSPRSLNLVLGCARAEKIGVQRMSLNEQIKQGNLFFFHTLISSWHVTFPRILLPIEDTHKKVISRSLYSAS